MPSRAGPTANSLPSVSAEAQTSTTSRRQAIPRPVGPRPTRGLLGHQRPPRLSEARTRDLDEEPFEVADHEHYAALEALSLLLDVYTRRDTRITLVERLSPTRSEGCRSSTSRRASALSTGCPPPSLNQWSSSTTSSPSERPTPERGDGVKFETPGPDVGDA